MKKPQKPMKKVVEKGPKTSAAPSKKPVAPARPAFPAKVGGLGTLGKTKIGGLGRGLDSLLEGASAKTLARVPQPVTVSAPASAPEIPASDKASASVLNIPVGAIRPSPYQPRHEFDEEQLEELCASIKTHGVIQPLVCRKVGKDQYELIAGERRLRAATKAELKEVPVVLLEAEDRAAAEMSLVENLQREDLNAIEEAEAYKALVDLFGLTQEAVAERVGKARASVANAMRLLDLSDELKQMLGSGAISVGHAKLLLGLEDEEERLRFARMTVAEDWTVRTLEKKIKQSKSPNVPKEILSDLPPDYVGLLLERFHSRFGTSVHITPSVRFANGRKGKGRIEIEYYGNEDLDRLLPLLGIDVNAE